MAALKFIVAFILLINIDQITSLNQNEALDEFSRILNLQFSEREAEEFAESFSKTFSRENVRRAVDEFADQIQNRFDQLRLGGVIDIILNGFIQGPGDKYRKLEANIQESGYDISALAKLLNNEIGTNVVDVKEDTVSLNPVGLSLIFQRYAFDFVKTQFPDNLFLQLTLTQLIQDEVKKSTPILQSILNDNKLRLDDLKVQRAQLKSILSPIQTNIAEVLENVVDFVIAFYVGDKPSNSIFKAFTNVTNTAVLRAAEIVLTVEENVNTVLNNIIYANGTTTQLSTKSGRYLGSSDKSSSDFDEYGNGLELRKPRTLVAISVITSLVNYVFGTFDTSSCIAIFLAIPVFIMSLTSGNFLIAAIVSLFVFPVTTIIQTIYYYILL